jgi:hypothetical protein
MKSLCAAYLFLTASKYPSSWLEAREIDGVPRHSQGDEEMAAFVAIVLGSACAFYGYALARFGREIKRLKARRARGISLVVPFRGMPESATYLDSVAKAKVTVLSAHGAVNRDVA